MTIYLSLLVALIGLLIFFASANEKIARAGFGAWVAGLAAFLITFASHLVNLFRAG
jgi:hypothetical protein